LDGNALVPKLDGDAFLVIRPGPVADVMEQVTAAIGDNIIAPPGESPLKIRIGRAGYPDDGRNAAELIALTKANAG
jgi:hypothetical protein